MRKILIFASGAKEGGGSGFEQLVRDSRSGVLPAQIVAVVSNHRTGGIYEKAARLGIPFEHFPKPYDAESYRAFVDRYQPDLTLFAGWIKFAVGLDVRKTLNIHPAPLPRFGGKGMYGLRVHRTVLESGFSHSAVTIHFVNDEYDAGDIVFQCPVLMESDDTPKLLQKRIQLLEHWYYGRVAGRVLDGAILVTPEELPALKTAV